MIRDQFSLDLSAELIVDNFAGGGGASTGIELALGRHVDIAINHDPEALSLHATNHPQTRHIREDVFLVDIEKETAGRPVGLAWFSPDCKHFSKAKGGKPRSKKIRGLAWVVIKWAGLVRPRVIVLENVEEFQDWGPLRKDGTPNPKGRGKTFRRFVRELRAMGYVVDWRELRACDYGAPTIRKRLFLIARCDGKPIVWPTPTHGEGLKPYRTAAECIDWSIPCPSIFGRKKPLADATLRRIAKGIMRYVVNSPKPFIVPLTHQGGFRGQSADAPLPTVTAADHHSVVTASLVGVGGRAGQSRPRGADEPAATITTKADSAVVAATLMRQFGTSNAADITAPLGTVMADGGGKTGLVQAFLIKYYGNEKEGVELKEPMHTVTARDRFGLVTVAGEQYAITDIGLRMLQPRELYRAQGFPESYIIGDKPGDSIRLSKSAQVRMCGNSVCPPMAAAIVRANVPELAAWSRAERKELEAVES